MGNLVVVGVVAGIAVWIGLCTVAKALARSIRTAIVTNANIGIRFIVMVDI